MSSLEFLQQKWRVWFTSLDVKKSGVLTSASWTEAAEVLIKAHPLTGPDADTARHSFSKFGDTVLGQGHMKGQAAVTQEQFVDNLTAFYQKDAQEALKYINAIVHALFDALDTNKDSMVNERDFVLMCEAFGHTEDRSCRIFKLISGGKELAAVDACVKFWSDVWLGEDKKKWDEVTSALEM